MSKWSVYVCEDARTNFQQIVIERYAGTFASEEIAMACVRRFGLPCRIREESSDVRLNEDGTRVLP